MSDWGDDSWDDDDNGGDSWGDDPMDDTWGSNDANDISTTNTNTDGQITTTNQQQQQQDVLNINDLIGNAMFDVDEALEQSPVDLLKLVSLYHQVIKLANDETTNDDPITFETYSAIYKAKCGLCSCYIQLSDRTKCTESFQHVLNYMSHISQDEAMKEIFLLCQLNDNYKTLTDLYTTTITYLQNQKDVNETFIDYLSLRHLTSLYHQGNHQEVLLKCAQLKLKKKNHKDIWYLLVLESKILKKKSMMSSNTSSECMNLLIQHSHSSLLLNETLPLLNNPSCQSVMKELWAMMLSSYYKQWEQAYSLFYQAFMAYTVLREK